MLYRLTSLNSKNTKCGSGTEPKEPSPPVARAQTGSSHLAGHLTLANKMLKTRQLVNGDNFTSGDMP